MDCSLPGSSVHGIFEPQTTSTRLYAGGELQGSPLFRPEGRDGEIFRGFQVGFPGGSAGKEPICQCRRYKRHRFHPWVGKIPCIQRELPKASSCGNCVYVTSGSARVCGQGSGNFSTGIEQQFFTCNFLIQCHFSLRLSQIVFFPPSWTPSFLGTIALISYASKVMLKILQARLQHDGTTWRLERGWHGEPGHPQREAVMAGYSTPGSSVHGISQARILE